MELVVGIIILIVGFGAYYFWETFKLSNCSHKDINVSKMMMDKMQNNLSNSQVRRNTINGKYNWKSGDYDIYTGKRH